MAIENWVRKAGTTYTYDDNLTGGGLFPAKDPTKAYDDNPNWPSVYGGYHLTGPGYVGFGATFSSPITMSRIGGSGLTWVVGGGARPRWQIDYYNGAWVTQDSGNTNLGNFATKETTILDYTELSISNVTQVRMWLTGSNDGSGLDLWIGELWAYGEGGKGPLPLHFNNAGLPI